ncbi:hypothetical protein GCM10022261_12690 [Brevibacterium daeguense]|uniref:HNH nuclease domain-containing protein n=1 Tax=Brevibacterium daeguense TaxID=909936 RepID=A0ABP8EIE8_9MICO|nr:HNH endonuclease signature motif containing protein [Brevibacterium daeguense]
MTMVTPENVKQILAAMVAKAEPPSRPEPAEKSRAEAASNSPISGAQVPKVTSEESEAGSDGEAPAAAPNSADFRGLVDRAAREHLGSACPALLGLLDSLSVVSAEVGETVGAFADVEVVAVLRATEAIRRVTDSLSVSLLARFERSGLPEGFGVRSSKALVMQQLKVSSAEAARRVAMARRLGERVALTGEAQAPEFPLIASKVHEGDLNTDQVQAMLSTFNRLPPAVRARHWEGAEALLVEQADRLSVKELGLVGRRIVDHLDPDGACPRDVPDRESYSLTLTALESGDYRVRGLLDAMTGTTLLSLIEDRVKSTRSTGGGTAKSAESRVSPRESNSGGDTGDSHSTVDGAAGATFGGAVGGTFGGAGARATAESDPGNRLGSGEEVLNREDPPDPFDAPPNGIGVTATGEPSGVSSLFVLDQRSTRLERYDAFAALVKDAGVHRNSHGPAYALVISATAEQVARGTGTATTQYRAPVRVEEAIAHLCAAKVYLQTWDDERGTVALRTENRFANKHQLTALAARDQGCTFPDCEVPPVYCEAHHMVPYSRGGPTDINSMTLLCGFHHGWHDRNGWQVVLLGGLPGWIPPSRVDPAQEPIFHAKFRSRIGPAMPEYLDSVSDHVQNQLSLVRQPPPPTRQRPDVPPF